MNNDVNDLIGGNGRDPQMPPPQADEPQHRGRTPIPEGETRAEAFVRLAVGRVTNVQHHMGLLCHLAKYPHNDGQRDKILNALRKSMEQVEAAFSPKNNQEKFHF